MTRAGIAALLLLAGCTQAQREAAQPYQDKIAALCKVAMMVAPAAGPVAPWIIGGCSAAGIAKLVTDPSSIEWLEGLIAKAS